MSGTESSPLLVSCGNAVRAFNFDGTEVPVSLSPIYSNAHPTIARWYPNGRLLAVGLTSGLIAFHHHVELDCIGHINALSGARSPSAILCIDVTNGSRFLAAGTESGELNIWDMKNSVIVNRFSVSGPVQSVSFQHTSDSRYVACSSGSDVMVFSRASGRLVDSFTVANDKVSFGSPGGVPGDEAASSTMHRASSSSRAKVTAVAFSSHSVNLLAVTDDSGCVNVWDVSRTHASRAAATPQRSSKIGTDATYSRFTSPLRTPATDLVFASSTSPVGLFVAGLDKHIRVYDKSLRRFLFSIICSAPVTSIGYCWDDLHIAAGHTNGETTIFKINFTAKSAEIVVSLPAASNRSSTDSHLPVSTSIRSLHFQPQVSESTDGQMPSTPKVPKGTPTEDPLGQELGRTPYGRDWRETHMATRAKTSPSPALMSGMLVPLPERPADDSLIRHNPRDSDIFSPITRPAQAKRNIALNTPNNQILAKNLVSDYRRTEVRDPDESRKFPSSVPAVMDRRVSDLIPSMAPVGKQYTSFQDTSRGETDSKQGSLLDGDAVDSLLGSSPGETFGTGANRMEIPSSSAPLEKSRPGGSALFTPVREIELDDERGKVTTLPRGQAFRRLRKSVSEVSPRKQLPPLQPRSNTTANLKGSSDEESAAESEKQLPSYAVRQVEEIRNESVRRIGAQEVENVLRSPRAGREHAAETTAIPPLQRKSGISNGQDKQLSEISKSVKQTIVAELDAVREDLRSDILNIHTELVLSSSRQVREVERMFNERDKVIEELRKEVAELRKVNIQLQEMYIDD